MFDLFQYHESFIEKDFRLVRKMIWVWSKYIHIKLKAKTVQGVFIIPSNSIRANDFISKSLYVDKCFEYDIYRRSIEFLKSKIFLSEEGINTLIDVGINNGVISIGALYPRISTIRSVSTGAKITLKIVGEMSK